MSLQKTSLPALEIDAGAVIEAPLPAVVVVVDSLLLLLLPPQPLPARASAQMTLLARQTEQTQHYWARWRQVRVQRV